MSSTWYSVLSTEYTRGSDLASVSMRTIGNVLWLVLAGVWLAISYAVAGVINAVFIVTIPFAVQSFKLAGYALWPFGRVVVDRPGADPDLSLIGNLIWRVFGGVWIVIGHLVTSLILAVTIIGIPLAVANLKLATLALAPFGKDVMTIEEFERRGVPAAGQVRSLGDV